MSKITILRGLPASGKSTKAKELLSTMGNAVRINKDLLRTMLHFDSFTGIKEGQTRDASTELARYYLALGINVIIDDTNLNPKTVEAYKAISRETEAKIEYIDLETSVLECIERDNSRDIRVGRHVIEKMALQYKNYLAGEEVIICDLDGTLCNIDHRLHFVKKEPKDWKSFFANLHLDMPNEVIKREVKEHIFAKKKVIFVSARPEEYRTETQLWLWNKLALGAVSYTLIMRENHDKRPDTEVKSEIYTKYLKHLNIVKVFDDRPSIVRMWKEKGLNVIDVGKGVEF